MSRSFGDTLAASVGVVSEPEVGFVEVSPFDKCLLLASDGVWEFVSNQEAVDTVRPMVQKGDPKAACQALVKKARDRWRQQEETIDDITVVLLIL
ncbi:hypothetical protein EBH_0019540 [Eimeria brunetti]|uniref:PPM-type phosphatase domain-containing protein n=1 Tax=Eimeria brunetti TaxID=51314 RepID=U6LCP9_9EIME|nr:hypothetical protein EBH_0019540 [Eimeria brunetti]